jgi:ACT domain-containing protein
VSSRDLQAVVKTQKAFIKELLDRLDGKNLYAQIVFSIKDKSYSVADLLDLLNDTYFNGLTLEQILELAKKSIRLTDDNCKMWHKLEDIKTFVSMYNNDPLFKRVLDIIEEDIQEL